MHIRIVWLQIVEFDIFYHLEQSLFGAICAGTRTGIFSSCLSLIYKQELS